MNFLTMHAHLCVTIGSWSIDFSYLETARENLNLDTYIAIIKLSKESSSRQ